MVVNDSDIQGFTYSDALRHSDLNSSTKLSSKNLSSTYNDVVGHMHEVNQSGSCSSISTRYFYSNAVDKKCMQGLLARGKKATMLAKQFVNPVKVNTRVFVSRFELKPGYTNQKPYVKNPKVQCVQYRGSEAGVTGNVTFPSNSNTPSSVVGQDNKNPVLIVEVRVKSRTSCINNGGVMNQSGVNNANNGHLTDAPHNSKNQLVSLGHNSCPEKVSSGDSYDNGIECQKNAMQTNVFNARRGIDIPDKVVDNMLLYDVNTDSGDDNFELSNAMLLKDGWKNMCLT